MWRRTASVCLFSKSSPSHMSLGAVQAYLSRPIPPPHPTCLPTFVPVLSIKPPSPTLTLRPSLPSTGKTVRSIPSSRELHRRSLPCSSGLR